MKQQIRNKRFTRDVIDTPGRCARELERDVAKDGASERVDASVVRLRSAVADRRAVTLRHRHGTDLGQMRGVPREDLRSGVSFTTLLSCEGGRDDIGVTDVMAKHGYRTSGICS